MEIRPVRSSEYEEAGQIARGAYQDFFAGTVHDLYLDEIADVAGRSARTSVLVALSRGRIVGTVTVELSLRVDAEPRRRLDGDEAHLRMLAVAAAARGLGTGRALVDAAVALARASGKRRMTLNTMPEMTAAQKLYSSMGFRRGPDDHIGSGVCMFSYELELAHS